MAVNLSSNHYSPDQQLRDVLDWLEKHEPTLFGEFTSAHPAWRRVEFSGAWIDAETMGVDPDWSSWCVDWLENHTSVYWEDGEPWTPEEGDEPKGDG